MEDLHNVGGTPAVLKYLLEKELIDVMYTVIILIEISV